MSNYCFTDLHGMYDLWAQIRDYAKPTDKLYFLGDAMDRGSRGIKIIQELFLDSRVIFIKGNHEEIFVDTIKDLNENTLYFWYMNGGECTYNDFKLLSKARQYKLTHLCEQIPEHMIYKSYKGHGVFLCHAGVSLQYNSFTSYLWDRHHFVDKWHPVDSNLYMVHGHTPVQYIKAALGIDLIPDYDEYNKPNILTYADGHKFDLDLASFDTKKIALFDLDELKVAKYFYTEEE